MLTLLRLGPILLTLAIALLTLFHDEKRTRSRKITYGGLYAALALISCGIIWADRLSTLKAQAESAAAKSDADNWRQEQQRGLELVGAKLDDNTMLQKFVEDERVLAGQLVASKTGPVQEQFFDATNAAERLKARTAIDAANGKILSGYEAQFQPVVDLVTQNFDSWVTAAQAHGTSISREHPDEKNLVAVVSDNSGGNWVRKITFKNGTKVWLLFQPALVRDGTLVQQLSLNLTSFSKMGDGTELWQLDLLGKVFRVRLIPPTRIDSPQYESDKGSPMGDKQFVGATVDSLNEAFESVLQRAEL